MIETNVLSLIGICLSCFALGMTVSGYIWTRALKRSERQ